MIGAVELRSVTSPRKPLVVGSNPSAATTPHKSTSTDQGIQLKQAVDSFVWSGTPSVHSG